VFPAATVLGLDRSAGFVEEAVGRADDDGGGGRLRFRCADVTALPLPGAPADLVFVRFLLAHLPEPGNVAQGWATQLRAGGVLAVEEVEDIATEDLDFTSYLSLTRGLVAHGGSDMYAGPLLARSLGGQVVTVAVTAGDAATLFSLNLETIRHDPWVVAARPAEEVDALARRLAERRADPRTGVITWALRQLVLRAPAP